MKNLILVAGPLLLFGLMFSIVHAQPGLVPPGGTQTESEDCDPPVCYPAQENNSVVGDILEGEDVVGDIIVEGAAATGDPASAEAGEGEGTTVGNPAASETGGSPDAMSGAGRGDTGGIVPCSGLDCDACSVVKLIENIVDWLIGVMLVIFAIVTAVAGFKLVMSGGNTAAKTKAKEMLTNAFIGIIIVLTAWLLIDTLMRALLPSGTGTLEGYGPWSSVQCNSQVEPVAGPDSGGGTTVGNPALVIPDGCTNEGPSGTSNATVIVCQGDVLGNLPPAPVGNCSEPSRDSTGGNNTTRLVYTYVCQIGP